MPTREEINRQIKAYPDRYIFWTKKEIRALPEVLDYDETVKAITSGMVDSSTWLAVCTERRVIFLNRGMVYGLRQVQFPINRIQSIDHKFAIAFGSISVWDGASAFTLNMILRTAIIPFVRKVEAQMAGLQRPQGFSVAAPTDVASQLEKLASLKERGHITEKEFQAQKKKLLG